MKPRNTLAPFRDRPDNTEALKEPPVSIILGFRLHDALVVASDSQGSYGGTAKRSDIKKVIAKTLKNKVVVFARAGNLETADVFEEAFGAELEASDLGPSLAIADCAERAMKSTRKRVAFNMRADGFSEEYMGQHMRNCHCDIIFGYIANKQPVLYRLRLDNAIASRCSEAYAAEGCAANLAGSVLEGYNLPQLDPPSAIGLAAYAVEFCKAHDSACDGKTQLALLVQLPNGSEGIAFFNEREESLAKAARKTMQKAQVHLHATMAKNMAHIIRPVSDPSKATFSTPAQSKIE